MQSLNDAARMALSGFPGGLVALCARTGWNYETTRKEIAGGQGFKLDSGKLLLISQMCIEAGGEHSHAIFNAFTMAHGVLQVLPVVDLEAREVSLLDAASGNCHSSTDLLRAVAAAKADDKISDNERKSIERIVQNNIDCLQSVLAEVQRENESSKPAHIRSAA